jgi:hypothetical protein
MLKKIRISTINTLNYFFSFKVILFLGLIITLDISYVSKARAVNPIIAIEGASWGFNIYEGLELAAYLQKHKESVVCIQKLENKNLYKFHFVKKCENGIQLRNKDLFNRTGNNLHYMKNWIYKEDTLRGVLKHIRDDKNLLDKLTNNFAYYRNFNSVKDKSYVIDVFDPREADSTNIIVCRKKTYGKNIKSLQFAGYPKDILNLNRKRFKSSDFYGEHLVDDDYYTNGICEDGYSNVTKKKNNQVLSVGYSPYIKFDQKSLIAFKKEKQTQITKAEPRQTQKVAKVEEPKQEEFKPVNKWYASAKHPKSSKLFIATKVSNELDAKKIAIQKCYEFVSKELGKWGYNDCYIDLTVDETVQGKVAKVEEPKQEEIKSKSTNQDKDPPVIQIASNITVSDTTYEIEGVVKDNSENIFVEIDGQTIQAKNGKFKLQRYSPIDHQLKIVAVDQWGNRSEPKLVDIKIELQVAKSASIIEPLNPSNLKVKADRNKVALVIGVEKYENTPSAKFASLDAKYFKDYARKAFGVHEDNINLLTDEEANFSKTTSAFFKWLPSKIKSNKTDLIIFYAGHGLASSDGKDKYILPFDADPDLLSRTAISRKEIFDLIISLKPRSVTIFLDTCYSGVSRDEQMLLASARPLRVIADDDEKLPDNFTIFSASENDQISSGLESAKHGIFSYYLMKGLEGKADLDQDGKLTNNELLTYLDNNVSEKALDLGRQQNPTLTGNPDQILARY